jgi:signal peptidase I
MPPVIMQGVWVLSWLAVPVGLVCLIDDWLLRPRRQLAAAPSPAAEPPAQALFYAALPVLLGAAVVRLLASGQINFSALLAGVSAITGLIWAVDARILLRRRKAAAAAAGKDPSVVPEPRTVEYARSFFPVVLAVLMVRAFVFEPFRIPSDSMMPTLRDGDFILVEKFAYGLRLPVTHTKILDTGEPRHGQVVVFHPPMKPAQAWIKRAVGLPGDQVTVRDDRLTLNGKAVPFNITGTFRDGCYENMELATERLGTHTHQALLCPVPLEVTAAPLPSCKRSDARGYVCDEPAPEGAIALIEPRLFRTTVPPAHYLMIGDNRDNSDDGRFWGFVSERELIGRATYIWFNWDPHRRGGPLWRRIGMRIR